MGRGPVGRVLAWGLSSQTCLEGGQPRRTDRVSRALRGKGRVASLPSVQTPGPARCCGALPVGMSPDPLRGWGAERADTRLHLRALVRRTPALLSSHGSRGQLGSLQMAKHQTPVGADAVYTKRVQDSAVRILPDTRSLERWSENTPVAPFDPSSQGGVAAPECGCPC